MRSINQNQMHSLMGGFPPPEDKADRDIYFREFEKRVAFVDPELAIDITLIPGLAPTEFWQWLIADVA